MGQAVFRGEPIYANTFVTYTPLGALASAASMGVGAWVGVPTYLAPRYLAVMLGVLSVLLVSVVSRRATGSPWAGLIAGLVLAGFYRLAASYLSTLQPKHLVIFFALLAAALCQRRRWGLTGFAAGCAVSSYQPALWVPLSFGVIACWNGLRNGVRGPVIYTVGLFVGILPVALYLAATDGWADFWFRTVVIPAEARVSRMGASPGHWIDVLIRSYHTDLPFLVAGAAGWVGFGAQSALRGGRRGLDRWLCPESAGMPLLAALCCLSAMLEFQGPPDAYPLLPLAAFWSAWLVASFRPSDRRPIDRRLAAVVGAAAVLIVALLGFRDFAKPTRGFTLTQQLELVRRVWGPPGSTVVALFAEEIYVLSERRSPYPFLRLPRIFVPHLPHVGLRDCREVAQRIADTHPRAVALRISPMRRGCESSVARLLDERGYNRTRQLTFLIYWAPDVPPEFE